MIGRLLSAVGTGLLRTTDDAVMSMVPRVPSFSKTISGIPLIGSAIDNIKDAYSDSTPTAGKSAPTRVSGAGGSVEMRMLNSLSAIESSIKDLRNIASRQLALDNQALQMVDREMDREQYAQRESELKPHLAGGGGGGGKGGDKLGLPTAVGSIAALGMLGNPQMVKDIVLGTIKGLLPKSISDAIDSLGGEGDQKQVLQSGLAAGTAITRGTGYGLTAAAQKLAAPTTVTTTAPAPEPIRPAPAATGDIPQTRQDWRKMEMEKYQQLKNEGMKPGAAREAAKDFIKQQKAIPAPVPAAVAPTAATTTKPASTGAKALAGAAEGVGNVALKAGKYLGIAGVGLGAYDTYSAAKEGRYYDATMSGMTTAGTALMMTGAGFIPGAILTGIGTAGQLGKWAYNKWGPNAEKPGVSATGATPASGKKISKVLDSGAGYTTVLYEDGTQEKLTGSVAKRNNNPGNLRPTQWTQQQPGYIGSAKTSTGEFAVFATEQAGESAAKRLLFEGKYKNMTVGQTFGGADNTYAPSKDSNNPQVYLNAMQKAGFNLNTRMSDLSSADRERLYGVVRQVEGSGSGVGSSKMPDKAETRQAASNATPTMGTVNNSTVVNNVVNNNYYGQQGSTASGSGVRSSPAGARDRTGETVPAR